MVIANGENASGGNGLTYKNAQELFSYGIDAITMGNHVWDKKEIYKYIDEEPRLIRPANYPSPCPGKGYTTIIRDDIRVGIINLLGRSFLNTLDCPFRTFNRIHNELKESTDILIIDFHGEATAEKVAMGWYVDGKVSLIFGTHAHIQTADEKFYPWDWLYHRYWHDRSLPISYWNRKDIIIEKLITQRPVRFEVASGPIQINGLLVDINELTGECRTIERFFSLIDS